MIRLFTAKTRLLFFPKKWANAVSNWCLGVNSPSGTINIKNTANPTQGGSATFDVNLEKVSQGVKERLSSAFASPRQVTDAIAASADGSSLLSRDGRLLVNDDWLRRYVASYGGNKATITGSKSGKTTTVYADGTPFATILDGEDGADGQPGQPGQPGSDGQPGEDGKEITGIVSGTNADGKPTLNFHYSDGSSSGAIALNVKSLSQINDTTDSSGNISFTFVFSDGTTKGPVTMNAPVFRAYTITGGHELYCNAVKLCDVMDGDLQRSVADTLYAAIAHNHTTGEISNWSAATQGFLTAQNLANLVTTNTAQTITASKTLQSGGDTITLNVIQGENGSDDRRRVALSNGNIYLSGSYPSVWFRDAADNPIAYMQCGPTGTITISGGANSSTAISNSIRLAANATDETATGSKVVPTMGWVNDKFLRKSLTRTAFADGHKLLTTADVCAAGDFVPCGSTHAVAPSNHKHALSSIYFSTASGSETLAAWVASGTTSINAAKIFFGSGVTNVTSSNLAAQASAAGLMTAAAANAAYAAKSNYCVPATNDSTLWFRNAGNVSIGFITCNGTISLGGGAGYNVSPSNSVALAAQATDVTATGSKVVPTMGWVNDKFLRKSHTRTTFDANNDKLLTTADVCSAGDFVPCGDGHAVCPPDHKHTLEYVYFSSGGSETLSSWKAEGSNNINAAKVAGLTGNKWVKTTSGGALSTTDETPVSFSGTPTSGRLVITSGTDGNLTTLSAAGVSGTRLVTVVTEVTWTSEKKLKGKKSILTFKEGVLTNVGTETEFTIDTAVEES